MNTELSQAQIDNYQHNGFIVIDDFLTPKELELWRNVTNAAVASRGKTKLAGQEGEEKWQEGDGYYDHVFVQRINLWQDSPAMKALMFDAQIGKMAASLAGAEGMRIWHDQALIKQPWGNPTGWHLDNPYWSFSSQQSISMWVALDDATLENGCLYFVPETHKTATYDNANIGQNIGDLFKEYPDWANLKAVAAPMKAGSCSFHNGLAAHGAGANMTPGSRRAMTCAYMPDGATFNGKSNVLPKAYLATLKEGDVLEDDAQNPLIYHSSKSYITQ